MYKSAGVSLFSMLQLLFVIQQIQLLPKMVSSIQIIISFKMKLLDQFQWKIQIWIKRGPSAWKSHRETPSTL